MSVPTEITGAMLLGAEERRSQHAFTAIDPTTNASLSPTFSEADAADVAAACALADAAFAQLLELPPVARARFLQCIGAEITALGGQLIDRAMRETGLPRARLEGERARTVGQLDFFADIVRKGEWIDATIDWVQAHRLPAPRPDLRRRLIGIGPVAVFGASNFPLAFSVAGGDSAAALAAGCPIVVKGHPSHPGTGELVARAVRAAVAKCGMPAGTFSYLPGTTHALGAALVADARIRAVGFTGSRAGGLALAHIAASRPDPIPVFAEMSSINPVILLPAAARARGAELGRAYVASVTLGAGQFCTNPGVLLYLEGTEITAFRQAAIEAMRACPDQAMLAPGIHARFAEAVAGLSQHAAVETVVRAPSREGSNRGQGGLFGVAADHFMSDEALRREIFGPSSLMVSARDVSQLSTLIDSLEGQLTATLLFNDEDAPLVVALLPHLERKVGRIIANGWPTGVEVCHAMVHGGPYPATTDVRTSSVGALAIQRFLRPVCYQGLPDGLLPAALQASNPLGVPRRVDGVPASQGP